MASMFVDIIFLLAVQDIAQGPGAILLQLCSVCLQPFYLMLKSYCLCHAKLYWLWSLQTEGAT